MEPKSPHIVVLDVGTKKSFNREYTQGQVDRLQMNMACVWDSESKRIEVYDEEAVNDLVSHLKEANIVVGFNITRFDYKVLSGYSPHESIVADLRPKTVDLLRLIEEQLGHRLKLGDVASKTIGKSKLPKGSRGKGRIHKIESCKRDVELARDLFMHILNKGYIEYSTSAGVAASKIKMDLPWQWVSEQPPSPTPQPPPNWKNFAVGFVGGSVLGGLIALLIYLLR